MARVSLEARVGHVVAWWAGGARQDHSPADPALRVSSRPRAVRRRGRRARYACFAGGRSPSFPETCCSTLRGETPPAPGRERHRGAAAAPIAGADDSSALPEGYATPQGARAASSRWGQKHACRSTRDCVLRSRVPSRRPTSALDPTRYASGRLAPRGGAGVVFVIGTALTIARRPILFPGRGERAGARPHEIYRRGPPGLPALRQLRPGRGRVIRALAGLGPAGARPGGSRGCAATRTRAGRRDARAPDPARDRRGAASPGCARARLSVRQRRSGLSGARGLEGRSAREVTRVRLGRRHHYVGVGRRECSDWRCRDSWSEARLMVPATGGRPSRLRP